MAKGNEIVVTPGPQGPRGRFFEGIISGTPKPGTTLQLKAGVEPIQGAFTYEVVNRTISGQRGPTIVLLPDQMQSKTALDAYADGDRCFLYMPQNGDELNMLITADNGALAIGDQLMVQDNTGLLIKVTAQAADYATPDLDTEAELIVAINLLKNRPQVAPFVVQETTTDPSAAKLLRCLFGT